MLNKIVKLTNDETLSYLLKKRKFSILLNTFQRIASRTLLKKKNFMPNKIQMDIEEINRSEIIIYFNTIVHVSSFKIVDTRPCSTESAPRLSTANVQLSPKSFYMDFEDNETLFEVHRFGWLLTGLQKYANIAYCEKSAELLNYWIANFSDIKDNCQSCQETYSICESLLNIYYFISTLKLNKIDYTIDEKKLAHIFQIQLNYIVNNIEFRGENTNNHILNNARALYVLGSVFKINSLKTLGEELIYQYFPTIIRDGILLEGSSHYQMLLSRTFLEIYSISCKINDKEMIIFLKDDLIAMLNHCDSLQSKFTALYPLIGDVSPDFEPGFFSGFPFSSNREIISPWYQLFGNNDIENLVTDSTNLENSKYKFWNKFEYHNMELWIVKKNYGVLVHGHNDNGSFILFCNGKPIIIDIGRNSYDERISADSIKADSHNGLRLKNEKLDVNRESILLYYIDIFSKCDIDQLENTISVKLTNFIRSFSATYKIIFIDKNTIKFLIPDRNSMLFNSTGNVTTEKKNIIFEDGITIKTNKKNYILTKNNYSAQYGRLAKGCRIEASNEI